MVLKRMPAHECSDSSRSGIDGDDLWGRAHVSFRLRIAPMYLQLASINFELMHFLQRFEAWVHVECDESLVGEGTHEVTNQIDLYSAGEARKELPEVILRHIDVTMEIGYNELTLPFERLAEPIRDLNWSRDCWLRRRSTL